jgi:hypothetical protein
VTSDIPPLTDEFFTKLKLQMPKSSVKITPQVDPEIFAWFQSQGETSENDEEF